MNSRLIFLILILLVITNISFWYKKASRYILSCPSTSTEESRNEMNMENRNTSISSHVPLPTGIWTVEPSGRLGNLIGQYATLYSFAKLHGHQAYILPAMHSVLSEIFRIKLPVINEKVAKQIPWKTYTIRNNGMSKEYYELSGEFVKLHGYPFSWTYYHHLRREILNEFVFHDSIRVQSNDYLANIQGNKTNVTFIGIHVRRGDYVNIMQSSKKGVVASKEYLQKAIEYFRNTYKNPLFVVASNGMDWCKKNIDNTMGDVYFLGNGNERLPIHDFALLAHCNHTIMTIGSFGIYAAYFAGGETIYLANYTLPGFPFSTDERDETIYLPEWIGIPADLSPLYSSKDRH